MISSTWEHPLVGTMAGAESVAPGRFRTYAGELSLPIRYHGARTFLCTLPAKRSALNQLLPPGLTARRLYADNGALVIQFLDMPSTTIGPYRECVIGILCADDDGWPAPEEPGWRPGPCFALWLCVTTPIACASGQAIWAYPKVLADTGFTVQDRDFHGWVHMDGQLALECHAQVPKESEHVTIEMRTLTTCRSEILRTVIRGEADVSLEEQGPCRLAIHPGTRISDLLGSLSIGADPVHRVYLTSFDYTLEAPLASGAIR